MISENENSSVVMGAPFVATDVILAVKFRSSLEIVQAYPLFEWVYGMKGSLREWSQWIAHWCKTRIRA